MTVQALAIKAAWGITLVAVAWAAIGLSLDLASVNAPELASGVPGPFQGEATRRQAFAAIEQGRAETALERATANLAADPAPAESLSLLALAAGISATPEGNALSSKAITLAAQRGWRDPVAQLAAYNAAVQSGQMEFASQRLDAIFRVGVIEREMRMTALAQLASDPEGREQLAKRLSETRNWTREFLTDSFNVMAADNIANVVVRTMANHGSFDCQQVSVAVQRLLTGGEGLASRRIWQVSCAPAHRVQDKNLNFEVPTSNIDDPFAWRLPEVAGLSLAIEQGSGQPELRFRNDNQLRRDIAVRYLTLSPGMHSLAVLVRPSGGRTAPTIWLDVRCTGKDGQTLSPLTRLSTRTFRFFVPARACAVQLVRIQSGPTGDREAFLTIY